MFNFVCLYCNGDYETKDRRSKFCSRSCAAINNNRLKGNKHESRIRKFASSKYDFTAITRKKCTHCNIDFWSTKISPDRYRSTCSDTCFIAIKRANAKGIKLHEYRGMVFQSKWEIDVAIFLDTHGITWSQPLPISYLDKNGKIRKYFPDFYLPHIDLYIDPKNPYCIQQQKEKLDIIEQTHNLIYGNPIALQREIMKWLE